MGLPTYVELSYVLGLTDSISRCLNVRGNGQGFKDHEMLMALILLNLAGGMLPSGKFGVKADYANDLARLDVSHVTITVNSIDPEIQHGFKVRQTLNYSSKMTIMALYKITPPLKGRGA